MGPQTFPGSQNASNCRAPGLTFKVFTVHLLISQMEDAPADRVQLGKFELNLKTGELYPAGQQTHDQKVLLQRTALPGPPNTRNNLPQLGNKSEAMMVLSPWPKIDKAEPMDLGLNCKPPLLLQPWLSEVPELPRSMMRDSVR